jgi:flagellar biosynthesis protein FlhF
MIIKTITAESVAAALKRVRSELGPQAVVLKTRQLEGRGMNERVEITACLDNPSVAQTSAALADAKPVVRATFNRLSGTSSKPTPTVSRTTDVKPTAAKTDRISELERKLDRLLQLNDRQTAHIGAGSTYGIRERLLDADVPGTVVDELLSGVSDSKAEESAVLADVRKQLTRKLSGLMLPTIQFKAGDRVAFIGGAGSGKTSCMGKLAARLSYQDRLKTTLISLDDAKVGAYEEIESYADLLGSLVINSHNGKYNFDNTAVTLIDTPAMPLAESRVQALSSALKTIEPTLCFATFSALTRTVDASTMAERLLAYKPTHLVMTMLDLTERWGSVFALTEKTGLKVVYATNSAGGIGTLNAPDPALFVRTFLKAEVCIE